MGGGCIPLDFPLDLEYQHDTTTERHDMNTTALAEYTATTEEEAHHKRGKLIVLGFQVSLIAYDPCRDLYVFDVIR